MIELIIRSGKHQGKKLKLPDSEITIGRDKTCRIRLASSDVSRQHCIIRKTDLGLFVRDLGSANGTFINEVPVHDEMLLEPGDVLRIGPMEMQVPGKKVRKEKSEGESIIFSEDDIANWLSDGEPEKAGGATTIIRLDEQAKKQAGPAAAAVPPQKKQFKSVAEEAADIIRRHWDSVGHENPSSAG